MTGIGTQIKNALGWFLTKLKGNVVNNLTSTSTDLPLSAAKGKDLQDQITSLNTNSSYEFLIASNQRSSFRLDKKNRVVHFVFNANMEGIPNTATIKVLSSAMRPASDQMFYGMCVSDSGYQGCAIRIGANGNVDVLASTYNDYIKGCCISGMYQVQ